MVVCEEAEGGRGANRDKKMRKEKMRREKRKMVFEGGGEMAEIVEGYEKEMLLLKERSSKERQEKMRRMIW